MCVHAVVADVRCLEALSAVASTRRAPDSDSRLYDNQPARLKKRGEGRSQGSVFWELREQNREAEQSGFCEAGVNLENKSGVFGP